jgi:hypothetical protein
LKKIYLINKYVWYWFWNWLNYLLEVRVVGEGTGRNIVEGTSSGVIEATGDEGVPVWASDVPVVKLLDSKRLNWSLLLYSKALISASRILILKLSVANVNAWAICSSWTPSRRRTAATVVLPLTSRFTIQYFFQEPQLWPPTAL